MSAGATALAGNAGLNPAFDPLLLQRVEDAGLNASAPPQQLWLDGWLVRFSPGKAKRARCINAVAAGVRPVAHKLREAEAVLGAAQLPMVLRITPFSIGTSTSASRAMCIRPRRSFGRHEPPKENPGLRYAGEMLRWRSSQNTRITSRASTSTAARSRPISFANVIFTA